MLCECNCGIEVNVGNRFVLGHNVRVKNNFNLSGNPFKNKKKIDGIWINKYLVPAKICFCKRCGKEHDGSIGRGDFCSRSCANSRLNNREIINAKISKELKGKSLSQERRDKIGLALKGRFIMEKASNWKGGKSFEPYPLGWNYTFKEQIRYRDGYKCRLCGVPEIECDEKLSVHHIDYDKSNIDPENLLSLCRRCHNKTGFNREFWKLMFQVIAGSIPASLEMGGSQEERQWIVNPPSVGSNPILPAIEKE